MDQRDSRPRSRGHGGSKMQERGLSTKVFNCIVDETSLIQGAKRSTRDGIPKWVAAGRMRLFVPLYALTQASRIKSSKGRAASDAGEALEWLDDATSTYPHLIALQGGFDKYETWEEVEKYALPKALFSEHDVEDTASVESLPLRTEKLSLHESGAARGSMSSNDSSTSAFSHRSVHSQVSGSPLSPPTSPPKTRATLNTNTMPQTNGRGDHASEKGRSNDTDKTCTPRSMQPLLNYIIWRVHQETDPTAALDSYIFLTDNASMKAHAQRFGIRSKTLTEFRYVISREVQDERNRQAAQHKGQQGHIAGKKSTSSVSSGRTPLVDGGDQDGAGSHRPVTPEMDRSVSDDDDDEILLKRAPRTSTAPTTSPRTQKPIIDPDQFHRGSLRGGAVEVRGGSRGSPRSSNARGRGGSRGRGRGGGRGAAAQPSEPIDPDSFSRPTSSRGNSRGGRGLWIPT